MGQEAKHKARRKAARAALRQAPKHIPVGDLPKEVSRAAQTKRDRALAQAARNYAAVQAQIRQQYWLDITGARKAGEAQA